MHSYDGYMYLNKGHDPPQSFRIWRVDFELITACLTHRVTRCIGYMDACVAFPNPTFW